MENIRVSTSKRTELVDITAFVQSAVTKTGLVSGVAVVFCPHTTAGLTINENADPSVSKDIVAALSGLVPAEAGYTHSEGNSDSHIKTSLFGPSLSVIVEDARLQLGTWQGIYLCESDGPRKREIWVKTIHA